MVFVPDYYRGTFCDIFKEDKSSIEAFAKRETVWEGKLKDDWEKSVLPHASNHGATLFGTVGASCSLLICSLLIYSIVHIRFQLRWILIGLTFRLSCV